MVVVVAKEDANSATEQLTAAGETVYALGHVTARTEQSEQVVIL